LRKSINGDEDSTCAPVRAAGYALETEQA